MTVGPEPTSFQEVVFDNCAPHFHICKLLGHWALPVNRLGIDLGPQVRSGVRPVGNWTVSEALLSSASCLPSPPPPAALSTVGEQVKLRPPSIVGMGSSPELCLLCNLCNWSLVPKSLGTTGRGDLTNPLIVSSTRTGKGSFRPFPFPCFPSLSVSSSQLSPGETPASSPVLRIFHFP